VHLTRASIVLACVLPPCVFAQQPAQPAPPKGAISGLVATADTGQPLRKTQVKLVARPSGTTVTTASDGEGRFTFGSVTAGEYTLSASKPSYLDMVFGARRHGANAAGTPIRIAAGQKIENPELRLPRGSTITGTITDEYGDPAFNTAVRVMRYVYSNGERYATPSGSDQTDDRGFYRVSGLPPGEYIVSAVPRDIVSTVMGSREIQRERAASAFAAAKAKGIEVPPGMRPDAIELLSKPIDPRGYVPVHYPGSVTPAGAATVRVGLSEEIAGIDIKLQIVHTANVTGTVTWAEGGVPASARPQLLDPVAPMPTIGAWWTSMLAGGKFVFYGVTPGSYVVRVHTSAGGNDLIAEADLQVSAGQDNHVRLQLQPARRCPAPSPSRARPWH
jgi:Carboxypeptidase regulatory-like domain